MFSEVNNAQHFPIRILREELRLEAVAVARKLSRSVGRLTSCDALPCEEYGEEVTLEHGLAERLLYIQHCRSALEQCIARSKVNLRYRWSDGTTTVIRFRKTGPSTVKVFGLLPLGQKAA